MLGDHQAGEPLVDEVDDARALEQQDAGDDLGAGRPERLGGTRELVHVEDRLRLEERAPASIFCRARSSWISHGSASGNSAAPMRKSVAAVERRAVHVGSRVHAGGDLEQLRRVEVEDALGLGMVSAARVVAGDDEHVLEPERPGREQVALQREPVPVSARLLEDRLAAAPLSSTTRDAASDPRCSVAPWLSVTLSAWHTGASFSTLASIAE